MTRRLLACGAVLLAACAGGERSPTSIDQTRNTAALGTKRYIVVYKDNVSGPQAATSQILQSIGVEADYVYGTALRGFAAPMTADAAARLRQDPRVKYVQADGVVHIQVTQSPATWGLDRIDQRNLPLTNSYTYNNTGAGVHFLASIPVFGGPIPSSPAGWRPAPPLFWTVAGPTIATDMAPTRPVQPPARPMGPPRG